MKSIRVRPGVSRVALGGLGALLAVTASGCQVDIGGQTLPSPYYQYDDVQYFPAGPEFILSREAAAMEAFKNQGLPPESVMPVAPQAAPLGPVPVLPGPVGPAPIGPVPVPVQPVPVAPVPGLP